MYDVCFDPYSQYEYIAKVESLLGGIGCIIHGNGMYQFGEYDHNDELIVFSPKMMPDDLNEFCRQNMKEYERIALENFISIQNMQPFRIQHFWE